MAEIDPKVLNIRQDTSEQKFYMDMKGQEEVYLEYNLLTDRQPVVVEFTKYHVPDVLDAVGIGAEMARRGVKFADKNGYKIKPKCPLMSGFMSRHPEYQYLLAG